MYNILSSSFRILFCILISATAPVPKHQMAAARGICNTTVPFIKIVGQFDMPALGYGLYQIHAEESEAATLLALSMGYRHLDSASFYANEGGVGRAIKASGIPREELFVATKVWTDCIGLGSDAVRSSVERSMAELQVTYLDMVYVHWPVPDKHVDAYKSLEGLVESGHIRTIGLSNYRVKDYQELMEAGVTVRPAVNQIEVNPFMFRRDVIDYFASEGIPTVAYKPLHRGDGLDHSVVAALAAKYGKTPGQVLLRWGAQHGFALLPKSVNPERMEQNLQCFSDDFSLSSQDMGILDALTTPGSAATFEAHFMKRAVQDRSGPTLPMYGPK